MKAWSTFLPVSSCRVFGVCWNYRSCCLSTNHNKSPTENRPAITNDSELPQTEKAKPNQTFWINMNVHTYMPTIVQSFTFGRKLCSLTKICPFPSRSFVVGHMVSLFCFPKSQNLYTKATTVGTENWKTKAHCMHAHFPCASRDTHFAKGHFCKAQFINRSSLLGPFTGQQDNRRPCFAPMLTHPGSRKGPLWFMDRILSLELSSKTKII